MTRRQTPPADRLPITRRTALAGAAIASAMTATASSQAQAAEPGPGVCVLTPEAVEGPFYYDPALVRSDVTEGRPGIPVELRVTLIEAAGCAPVEGARVDVWHCDAAGLYSGFDQTAETDRTTNTRAAFLRGTQFVGSDGVATFRTIYPGWYRGRTPHIHLKAFLDGRSVLTTQLYFPDALSEYIYSNVAAYKRPSERDTVNTTDGVLSETSNGRATFLNVREETDRYVAALTIAVDRRATSPTGDRRGPPEGDRRPPPGAGDRPPPPPPGGPEGPMGRPRPSGPLVPEAKA